MEFTEWSSPPLGSLTTNASTTVAWYTSVRWKFCASCAAKVGDDWHYCAGCGTPIGVISQGISTQPYVYPIGPVWLNPYVTWIMPQNGRYTIT